MGLREAWRVTRGRRVHGAHNGGAVLHVVREFAGRACARAGA